MTYETLHDREIVSGTPEEDADRVLQGMSVKLRWMDVGQLAVRLDHFIKSLAREVEESARILRG
jgi:hypothetical protein